MRKSTADPTSVIANTRTDSKSAQPHRSIPVGYRQDRCLYTQHAVACRPRSDDSAGTSSCPCSSIVAGTKLTIQAICLAPSRELARQIQEVVEKVGEFTSIKTQLAVPGSWDRKARCDKHIIIGTPGSLVEMLSRNKIFDPNMIRVFVLDEADEMIAMQGLGDQTRRIQRLVYAYPVQSLAMVAFN